VKNLRVLARVVVTHDDKILLVRNKGARFWYPPGGGWEYQEETILECAKREVKEETGYDVTVGKMLWLQEFHEGEKIFFETFWRAVIAPDNKQDTDGLMTHIDADANGMVEEAKWFTLPELNDIKVFPERIKTMDLGVEESATSIDPFIGVS